MHAHSRPFQVSRRGLLAAATIGVTAIPLAGRWPGDSIAHAAEANLGLTAEVDDQGIAATERNVRTAAAGITRKGIPLVYLLSDGNPVSFNVLNGDTGELIDSFPLPPKSIGSYPTVTPDGTAYFAVRDGKSSLVHRYDPVRNTVEFLVESPTGDAVTRALRVDGDVLYGCTYPNAKAFSYDLISGEVRDYGKVATTTDSYAWGFEKVGGSLYVGTGIGEGHVVRVDIDTGEKTELELPKEYDDQLTYFYAFRQVGDLVAMAFSPGLEDGTNVLFWDTTTQEWVHDSAIPGFLALNGPLTTATDDGRLWYKSDGEIYEFSATTGAVRATGWVDTGLEDTGSHRTLDMVMVGRARLARPILFGGNNDGSFWRFDPESGEHQHFDTQIEGAPLTTNTLTVGPDQRVYVPTYLGPGAIARFDPDTNQTEVLAGPGQADTLLALGSELLLGSYPNAVVHRGDPSQDWAYGTNPAKDYDLIADAQDRIMSMSGDADAQRYAVATVADYGISGGALTIVDADGTRQVHRDPIDLQSVVTVLWGPDNLVYAGTCRRGGLSSPTSPADAELLVFDPVDQTLVHHLVPVSGNDVVCEIALGSDGQVWGITKTGHLFAFDRDSRTVTADIQHGLGGTSTPWGSGCTIVAHPTDGLLYGLADGSLFAFDPVSHDWQVLDEGRALKRLDIAADGRLYAVDDTHLYQVTVTRED